MKLITKLLFAFTFLSFVATAQNAETITVQAGSSFDELFSKIYYFPSFTDGLVFYKDGTGSKGKLNYNLLEGEIQFIGPKGDTLNIANKNAIKNVTIGKDTFYYGKECLLILAGDFKAKLAASKRIKISDRRKIGAYGLSSSTSSATSYNTFISDSRVNRLTVQEDIIFTKTSRFFLLDNSAQVLSFTKKNILKLYPDFATQIDSYLNQNHVDFENEQNLISFIKYLNTL